MVLLIQLKGQLYREPGHLDPDSGPATDWIWRLSSQVPSVVWWPCSVAEIRGRWAGPTPSPPGSLLFTLHGPKTSGMPFLLNRPHLLYLLGFFYSEFILHTAERYGDPIVCGWVYPGSSVLRALVAAGTQREELVTTADTYWALTVYQTLF